MACVGAVRLNSRVGMAPFHALIAFRASAEQPAPPRHLHDCDRAATTSLLKAAANVAAVHAKEFESLTMSLPVPGSADEPLAMHLLSRGEGDFVPNNLVYHQIRQFVRGYYPDELRESRQRAFLNCTEAIAFGREATLDEQHGVTLDLQKAEDQVFEENGRWPESTAVNRKFHQAWALSEQVQSGGSDESLGTFMFHPYEVVGNDCVAHCTPHTSVLVNIKPIVPGHLMLIPNLAVPTIGCLPEPVLDDMGQVLATAVRVSRESYPNSDGIGIAIQQGAASGQTVAHLHVHVIPFSKKGILSGEPESDREEYVRRQPRTPEIMRAEACELRALFNKHKELCK